MPMPDYQRESTIYHYQGEAVLTDIGVATLSAEAQCGLRNFTEAIIRRDGLQPSLQMPGVILGIEEALSEGLREVFEGDKQSADTRPNVGISYEIDGDDRQGVITLATPPVDVATKGERCQYRTESIPQIRAQHAAVRAALVGWLEAGGQSAVA